MARKKFMIEDALEELDSIIASLEDPGVTLSDSLDYYKKGVRLLDKCSRTLESTEKEMIILQEDANGYIHAGTDQEEDRRD